PPGRGDRIALTGVRLLPDQQLVARHLPGGQVDDGRLAGEVVARVAGPGRHGVLRWVSWCARGSQGSMAAETARHAGTHRSERRAHSDRYHQSVRARAGWAGNWGD